MTYWRFHFDCEVLGAVLDCFRIPPGLMARADALNPERLSAVGLFLWVLCLGALDICVSNTVCEKPVFSPSHLAVKFGDPAKATCSICNSSCDYEIRVEEPFTATFKRGKQVIWNPSNVSEWSVDPLCYIFDSGCPVTYLHVTVYQPPQRVSVSFRNHSGALLEGHEYSLQCEVEAVAPAQNMTVAFYRGLENLSVQRSSSAEKSPVNESFSLVYNMSREDHGAQFWCEARLELGPEGPQPPPVVRSQNSTANVHYKPCCAGPAEPELNVTQGQSAELNCSTKGNPEPQYSWIVPSASTFRGRMLTIPSASFQHQGVYTCTATNALGALSRSFTITVHVPEVSIRMGTTPAAPETPATPAAPETPVTPAAPDTPAASAAPAPPVTPPDKNCAAQLSFLHLITTTSISVCVFCLVCLL